VISVQRLLGGAPAVVSGSWTLHGSLKVIMGGLSRRPFFSMDFQSSMAGAGVTRSCPRRLVLRIARSVLRRGFSMSR
jgi:hypothetical protein